jgi:hypothetical protein
MSLQLEKKVVSNNLWCVPRMRYLDGLVDTVHHLPLKPVVLQVIDSLELLEHNY